MTKELLTKKKKHRGELRVKFYLGRNKDCSLRGSTSDSSETELQRGSGGRSTYKILVKGELNAIKRSFYKRFSASRRSLCHHEGI